ncbi:hypothetical protein FDC45_13955 [Clostridium botulinum]|uniref:Uncharacterized protein n=1 Tax=Clostridium botulinum TaxID=1491 RepID=A0A846J6U3_CLOBO|nr:hypothetical protein [Clostridium botulinum]ACA54823.1 conserved hypothetical protein [Clostridium botulinum A3 str. Loch Maree]NFH65482.1 hypothetical protein [Clostridium botulinum]NFJ09748.1 hypothetical protein [Clostridium botulinum]NFK14728.1 hypothetical protein [Clostridium botulinum]NFM94276.1 hypothetical protein [Clostridium botulinum]
MKRSKGILGNIAATIYFIFPMCLILIILIVIPIGFLTDVSAIRGSGFAPPNTITPFMGICGFVIGLSLLIPPLRKMYKALPWLYPLTKIFYVNLVILSIGLEILNRGYQVINNARHATFFILMIIQIIACRIAMCIYFKLKPAKYIEER